MHVMGDDAIGIGLPTIHNHWPSLPRHQPLQQHSATPTRAMRQPLQQPVGTMDCDQLSPSRTIVTSFTPRKSWQDDNGNTAFDDGHWVLRLANNDSTLSCALSNGEVQVYDQNRLHRAVTFPAVHGDHLITDLVYGPQQSLVTSGQDGTVTVLDPKQGKPVLTGSLPPGQSALSVSLGFDGYLAAVGSTKGRIHFLDLRGGGALLGSYIDSHTDDVNRLAFHQDSPLLVSGGEDGLACIFDTTAATEDTALKSVMNVGTPLRQVGFCGTDMIYCLTGSETASLWNTETAACVKDFGMNFRQDLSQRVGDKLHVDYLVDAHWDAKSQDLLLAAGNFAGGAGIFRIGSDWEPHPCHLLTGGHRAIVRACGFLSNSMIITSGEDARLCEWNRLGRQSFVAKPSYLTAPGALKGRGGGPIPREKKRQKFAPY
jgi:hypothetical protein